VELFLNGDSCVRTVSPILSWISCIKRQSGALAKGRELNAVALDGFSARFAALRPSKPKSDFHPNTRKPRVLGTPGSWEQLRANLHPSTRKSRVPGAPGLRRKEMFLFEH
jgi:hypothetical protein